MLQALDGMMLGRNGVFETNHHGFTASILSSNLLLSMKLHLPLNFVVISTGTILAQRYEVQVHDHPFY